MAAILPRVAAQGSAIVAQRAACLGAAARPRLTKPAEELRFRRNLHPLSAEQFIAPGPFPHGGVRGTLAHTLRNEWGWRARLRGDRMDAPPPLRDEDFPSVAALAARWKEVERQMREYLSRLSDADLARDVALDAGRALPRWQLLLHVFNHSMQHRTEAAALLTSYGHSPGDLDFLFFVLEQTGGPA